MQINIENGGLLPEEKHFLPMSDRTNDYIQETLHGDKC